MCYKYNVIYLFMKSIIKNIIDKTPFTDRNVNLKNSLSTLINQNNKNF